VTVRSIPVFYTPRQVSVVSSMSPSAGKPSHVVASWRRLGVPIAIREPSPATVDDFARVHSRKYVEDVLAARCDNGFGNRGLQVAASLPWTTGSMVSAARYALHEGGVAVAPCSGFHHAGVEHASGYCTFNGLMVAAAKLHKQEGAKRIGILDCDQHRGDGTDEIIGWLGASRWIRHVTAGTGYQRNAKRFLAALPGIVRDFRDCDVLIYQAGADPHVEDPLGGFLSDDELAERDDIVFGEAKALRLPIAWNLAGGYQTPLRKVLDIHDRTMLACWRHFGGRE
jgi:acetoin utilization deacetylase AcuC-like enzyme